MSPEQQQALQAELATALAEAEQAAGGAARRERLPEIIEEFSNFTEDPAGHRAGQWGGG